MENMIAVILILVIVGTASFYIWKERKKGIKCIGCPMAGSCKKANGCSSCQSSSRGLSSVSRQEHRLRS